MQRFMSGFCLYIYLAQTLGMYTACTIPLYVCTNHNRFGFSAEILIIFGIVNGLKSQGTVMDEVFEKLSVLFFHQLQVKKITPGNACHHQVLFSHCSAIFLPVSNCHWNE